MKITILGSRPPRNRFAGRSILLLCPVVCRCQAFPFTAICNGIIGLVEMDKSSVADPTFWDGHWLGIRTGHKLRLSMFANGH